MRISELREECYLGGQRPDPVDRWFAWLIRVILICGSYIIWTML